MAHSADRNSVAESSMPENPLPSKSHSFAHRLPFFYGWVIIAVAFVTMGIGVECPDVVFVTLSHRS